MLRNWRFWLGLIISLLFLYWAFARIELGGLIQALREADYAWVVPAVLVYFVAVYLRGWRWKLLLKPLKDVTAYSLFRMVVIGFAANNTLPARLGELVRSYLLGRKEGLSKSSVLATVVVERVFDVLVMLAIIALGANVLAPVLEARQLPGTQLLPLMAAGFAALLGAFLWAAAQPRQAKRLAHLFLRHLPQALRERLDRLLHSFLEGLAVLRGPGGVLVLFGWSGLIWFLEAAKYWIIMQGFGFDTSFTVLALAMAIANLGTAIPSAPGYIGTFEFLTAQVLFLFGVAMEVGLSYALVLHAALYFPVTLLGFYYAWSEGMPGRWRFWVAPVIDEPR